jgi:hypothetical protein
MGRILSEPIKKVVEIPKALAEISVEDAKNHPKRPCRPRTSPGRKGRKKQKQNIGRFFAEKKRFSEKVLCFCLPWSLGTNCALTNYAPAKRLRGSTTSTPMNTAGRRLLTANQQPWE